MVDIDIPRSPANVQVPGIALRTSPASAGILARYGMSSGYHETLAERWAYGLAAYMLAKYNQPALPKLAVVKQGAIDSLKHFWRQMKPDQRESMRVFMRYVFKVIALIEYRLRMREIEDLL